MADPTQPTNPTPTDPANPAPTNPAPAPVLGTDTPADPANPAPTDPVDPNKPVLGTDPPKQEDLKPAEPVVPEKYEFKVADGVTLDEAVIGQFSEVAKGLKLTQEQAQALVDFQVSRDTSAAKASQEAYAKMTAGWAAETEKLPGIGGAQFKESVAIAQKAVDELGGPELNKALRDFGWGNHPALFKAFHAAGKLMAEAKVMAGAAADPVVDVAKKLFPLSSGSKS